MMANWLKYILSIGSGFVAGAAAPSQSGGGTKATLIGGALGALVALGNLHVNPPTPTSQGK